MKPTVSDQSQASTCADVWLLLGWSGLLLGCSLLQTSLMAHDEGTYAAESRFMLESGQLLARQWWGQPTYSHGILLNWLIIAGYQVLGVSDRVARLPDILACMASVVLTYDIGKILFASQPWPYAKAARQLALLSGLLLMLFSLWAQYGHLATQDMLLVSVELLGIWALLRAEQSRRRRTFGFLAGLSFGLGFLVKTFMIVLPALALLPYLILQHRRHRHLANPGLYAGLLTGIGAVALWLRLSVAEYGDLVWASMFGKIGELSEESFHADGGPFYYLWNIPVNILPWALFAIIGAGMVLRSLWKPGREAAQQPYPHRWLLLYPFILAALLTTFSTKTPYYTLQLHPFLAFFSALALYQIAYQKMRWPRLLLSVSFCVLGLIVTALAAIALLAPLLTSLVPNLLAEIRPYAPIALILGIGWALLPAFVNLPQKWLATWLIPVWLTLCGAGLVGLFGNYSPDLKADLTAPPMAPIVSAYPIDFITGAEWPPDAHKTFTLLSFYTPRLGQLNRPVESIRPGTYAWLSPNTAPEQLANRPYEQVGQLRDWQLIRF
ncbi:MAG: glycosyltransferase family 39 protein [Phormidesmis sp.]